MENGKKAGQSGVGSQGMAEGGGRGRRRGPSGFCIFPKCGEKMAHEMGKPCPDQECPKCGANMIRE